MRDSQTGKFIKKVQKIKAKKDLPKTLEDCTKQDLLKRIQEVMTRIWGKLPDDAVNWTYDKFKSWISLPFLYMDYDEYDDSYEI